MCAMLTPPHLAGREVSSASAEKEGGSKDSRATQAMAIGQKTRKKSAESVAPVPEHKRSARASGSKAE